jgi:hypothetical protein
MRSFIILFMLRYIRQIKSRRMGLGRACGTHGKVEKIVQGFGGKARKRERPF